MVNIGHVILHATNNSLVFGNEASQVNYEDYFFEYVAEKAKMKIACQQTASRDSGTDASQANAAFTAGSGARKLGACSRASPTSGGCFHSRSKKGSVLLGQVMAGAEVTVSPGQIMTVKKDEGEHGDNNHKTQVILRLEGLNGGTAETGTTILAIETHQDDSQAEGDEIEYGYPITCGDSRAVLLFKKFVCPGINVRCVKFNDQIISPKQFVHLAGKATLKDWKRAIRLGGVMLRKMMDSGQIDFYQHNSVCSNTCRSTKFDVLINSTRPPSGTPVQPSLSCLAPDPVGGQVTLLTGNVQSPAEETEPTEDTFNLSTEWTNGRPQLLNPPTANGHFAKRRKDNSPDGVLGLWRAVAESGLMGDVLSSLKTEMLSTLNGLQLRTEKANLHETDALTLHSLCEMFGLLDSVKQALGPKHSQNEESGIYNSVYVLGENLSDQKKQSCSKSRSCKTLNTLKHHRPHRQSNRRKQNFLTSISRSTVIHSPSVAGLCAATYEQFFPHSSAFTGQRQHTRTSGMDRDGQSFTPKEEQDMSLKRIYQPKQESKFLQKKETVERKVRHLGEFHIRSKTVEKTEDFEHSESEKHIKCNSVGLNEAICKRLKEDT